VLSNRPPVTEGQWARVCREPARAVSQNAAMGPLPEPRPPEEEALRRIT